MPDLQQAHGPCGPGGCSPVPLISGTNCFFDGFKPLAFVLGPQSGRSRLLSQIPKSPQTEASTLLPSAQPHHSRE